MKKSIPPQAAAKFADEKNVDRRKIIPQQAKAKPEFGKISIFKTEN